MVNIFNFEKSLKTKWIEKLVKHPTLPWNYLLRESVGSLKTLTIMGGNWIFNILNKANQFWLNVFNAWKEFCQKEQPTSNTNVVYSCLWFNGHLKHTCDVILLLKVCIIFR